MTRRRSPISCAIVLKSWDRSADQLHDPTSSRYGQLDHSIVLRPLRQTISRHGLDHWPVLSEKYRRIADVGRLNLDAAGLSSTAVRYLEMKRVSYCPRIFVTRSAFPAHRCPPSCVEPGHFEFTIRLFMRRAHGTARAASVLNYGLALWLGPGTPTSERGAAGPLNL
jgi:hypothetical protein